jgi:CRP/FNR family cyclic AMP-dependent transcriptional regulator
VTRVDLRRFMNDAPGEEPPLDTAETSFLADCDSEDWDRIVRRSEWRRFTAGETIGLEGDDDRALLVIVSGSAEILSTGEGGHARRVNVVHGPTLLGEVGFFDGRPRSGTIRALDDGELLRLPFAAFEALAAEAPVLARTILLDAGRIVALRLRRATTLIAT